MDLIGIGREALRTTWRHKALWLFGVFVASGGGGGAGVKTQPGADGGGAEALPVWAFALIGVAGLLGLAALWMHVVSEGALIDAAARVRRGEPVGARDGLRAGRASFGRVLGLKLLAIGVLLAGALLLGAPAAAGLLGLVPPWAAITLGLLIAVGVVPWLLTAYFVYAYALRAAVLDGLGARAAVRAGWDFLHGRVAESLKLLLLAFAGQLGGGLLAAAVIVPGALVGVGLWYWTGSWFPPAVAGALLVLPPALAVAGAIGTFRSTVWTVGYLESRAAARA